MKLTDLSDTEITVCAMLMASGAMSEIPDMIDQRVSTYWQSQLKKLVTETIQQTLLGWRDARPSTAGYEGAESGEVSPNFKAKAQVEGG
ncbi:hypothetical protein [Brevundimonas bullata]|uniref:hypothetical protein n=1 Tax=Brevundimonas bullata TaxID=13160 RepID=UPI002FDB7BCB